MVLLRGGWLCWKDPGLGGAGISPDGHPMLASPTAGCGRVAVSQAGGHSPYANGHHAAQGLGLAHRAGKRATLVGAVTEEK